VPRAYDPGMFATLLGALPTPPAPSEVSNDVDQTIEIAVGAQEDAGLEPVTDGRLRAAFDRTISGEKVIEAWRSTQALTQRAVKQALPGPFSSGSPVEQLIEVVAALAEAGCPLVEIEETAIDRLADAGERDRFRQVHERLLGLAPGTELAASTHLSLSIVGAAADPSAWETVLALPYASLAVDLIAGPDSWNLVTRWPGKRGVVAGVESSGRTDEPREVLLWAAHYAASTQRRGMNRVGLGSAGSFANLTWDAAVRKMRLLGEVARLATMPAGEDLYRSLDPRAVSPRRAALGHDG